MKDKILKNKKNLFIIGGVILLAIILIIVLFFFVFNKEKEMSVETLEDKLEKVGIDFYENYYYPNLTDEQKEALVNFKENGLRIDITNLEVLVTIEEDVKNQLEKDQCDFDQTKIAIYPKEPYGQKDYTIKLELSCEK